jgi:hypothetical protein
VCAIIEEHSYTAAGQLIPKAKLVGVVNPLADPDQRLWLCQRSWVLFRCHGKGGSEDLPLVSRPKNSQYQNPALLGAMVPEPSLTCRHEGHTISQSTEG